MRKRQLLIATIAIVAFVGLFSSAAQAVPPTNKAYAGFWEFNWDGLGPFTFFDCIEIDNSRFCSRDLFGKCGPIEITGMEDTIVGWTAALRNVGPGRIDIVGQTELRGSGSVSNAVGNWTKAPAGIRTNLSLDLVQVPSCADLVSAGGSEELAPKAQEMLKRKLEASPDR